MKRLFWTIVSVLALFILFTGKANASSDIELSTNRESPTTSQYVNLTIETDDDYTGKLTFSAKFRSASSSSWTTISNLTSSTYFSDYSDDWDNWYYKMKSSDDGEKTLKSLVKFRKKWYYRIYVKDAYGNQSYIQFNVGNVDDDDDENEDIDGLTTSETNRIKKVYKEWDSMINQMKRYYPSLKKDTYWRMMSDGLHENIKALIDGKHGNFDDYDDFEKAFDEWYKYTTTNI